MHIYTYKYEHKCILQVPVEVTKIVKEEVAKLVEVRFYTSYPTPHTLQPTPQHSSPNRQPQPLTPCTHPAPDTPNPKPHTSLGFL